MLSPVLSSLVILPLLSSLSFSSCLLMLTRNPTDFPSNRLNSMPFSAMIDTKLFSVFVHRKTHLQSTQFHFPRSDHHCRSLRLRIMAFSLPPKNRRNHRFRSKDFYQRHFCPLGQYDGVQIRDDGKFPPGKLHASRDRVVVIEISFSALSSPSTIAKKNHSPGRKVFPRPAKQAPFLRSRRTH